MHDSQFGGLGRLFRARLRLGKKVPLAIVGAAAVAAISATVVGYLGAESSLRSAIETKLGLVEIHRE